MLVTLVLLAILTLGAVSASDADSESLAVDDVGGSDSVASPVDDADLLSDGNGTVSNPDPDDGDEGTDFDDGDDEGGDEIEKIWVDESDLSLDDEDLDNHFAYVNTPEDAEGYVLVNCGGTVFFNKTLSSMDHGADEQNEGYYWHGISLNDVGKFAGLEKEDMIVFSLFDGDGQKVQSRIYFIYFGEGTIRLENDDSENLDDYTTIDGLTFSVMENMNIEDPYSVIKVAVFPDGIADSFSISLQKDDDEAIVTNWNLSSVDRDRAGYAMWNIEQLGIADGGEYSITFIFDIDDKDTEINMGNVNINSEGHGPDAWIIYEDNGKIYTDTQQGVVGVSVPYGTEGIVYVEVNDTEKGSWEIESYDEEYDSYHDWTLEDLGISGEGDYTIVVKLNDEILKTENITVYGFNNDEFRFVFDLEGKMAKLYCPEGIEGTLTVTTIKYFEEDSDEVYWDSFNLVNVTGWSEWNLMDLGLDYDDVWTEFTFYIANDEDELFTVNKKVRCSYDDAEYHINIWDEFDERGPLYTDSEGNVVGIDVSRSFDGNVIIYVNGKEIDNWNVEFDDEDGWAYHDWGLEDLGISKADNYTIVIVRDNCDETETLLNKTIAVNEFNDDTYRAMILYAAESIKLYIPDGAQGIVSIVTEKENEDGDLDEMGEVTYDITSDDYGNWKEWSLADLGFEADGAFRVFTLTVRDTNDEEVYRYRISHVDGEDEEGGDDYEEQIEFAFVTLDDDGYMEFNKTSDADVARLYIPDTDEFRGVVGTVTVRLNGEIIKTIKTDEFEDGNYNNHYPIVLDLSTLKDKDMLSFTVEALYENGDSAFDDEDEDEEHVWILILEDKGTYFIGHDDYDPERLEFGVFFGNLTTNHTNNPDLMGANFGDNFVIVTISNALEITEGTITVTDEKSNVIFSKQLSDCDKTYDYGSEGYTYSILLSEVKDKLPEGTNLTVTFSYANGSLTQKRIRFEDYLYTFVTLEDIERQFYFEINDDLLLHPSDNAIYLSTDTNRQSIYINLGGGYFTVYVNGVKVENLGNVSFNTWKEEGSWRYDDGAYEENDYPIGDGEEYPNEEAFLDYVRSYWGSELELFRLTSWNQGAPEIRITLADLGITESGTYNIRIVHYPSVPGGLDDHSSIGIESQYAEEMLNPTYTEVLNANITCNLDPDYAGVEILKERVYKNGQPFLFNFQFGDNVFSESNRILVYLNDELAFNSTTLFWEENDEGEMELVELWHLNDGLFNEEFLNDYGVLDAGEYEVVVYLVKGNDEPIEIASDNFTVLTQRGDMNFTIGYDEDVHTIIYADIPEGKWDGYSLEINIGDSESIVPSEEEVDDWFPRWYDEYVIFKDDQIALKESLDDIIGKGPVPIDLGVLPKGTHIWVVFYHGEETIFGDWDFYQNDFTVDYPSIAANVTKDNFFDFFDEDGVLTAVLTDITFIGDFTGLEVANIIINKPVTITGEDATFTDVSFNIDSDDVAISGISLKYTTPEDTDAYAIVAYNVANFLMENNTIAYIGLTDGTFTNNALRINGGSNIKIRNNAFIIIIPSAGVNYVEEDGVGNSYPVSEGIVFNDCEDVEFDANFVDVCFNEVVGSYDLIYAIDVKNSNKVAITNNNIRATGKTYIYGIIISAEDFEISDNAINVTSEYYVNAIDIVGPASGVVDNNTIDAAAPNSVYGIYATSFEGPSTVDFTYNTITGEGYYVVGIFDDSELIKGNVIKLTGNHTIGIAVLSEASVEDNTIILDASNIGNEVLYDAVNAETVGIYVTNDAFVTNNKVVSTAKSIIVLNGSSTFSNNDLTGFVSINSDYNVFENNSVVTDNEYAVEVNATENVIVDNFLSAKDLTGDDAVYAIEGNTIEDNREPSEEIESTIELSNDIEFTYNETGSAKVTLVGASDIIVSVVDHDEANVIVSDGLITVSGLDAGEYILNITTVPEKGFTATTKLVNITVNKIDVNLTVEVDDVNVGEVSRIRVFGYDIVKVRVGVNTYSVNCTGGVGYLELVLNAGTHNVNAKFEGDKNINPAEVNVTFTVSKLNPTIAINTGEAIEGSDLEVSVDIADATGVVSINGVNVTLTDGKATTTIKNIAAGDLTVDVVYFGDNKYLNASNSTTVVVKAKENAGLNITVNDIKVGETAVVNVEINSEVTGKVTIDGNEVTIADGKGTFTIDNLAAGEHTVTAVFAGDKYFKADEKTAAFTVTKLDSPISIDIPESQYTAFDNFQITIGNVTAVNVTINNKAYAVKADGTVDIDTTALDADTYTVVVSNEENDVYKANSTSKSFTIVKKASEVSIDVGANYNVGDDFAIEIDNNTIVTVTINDVAYEIKDGKVVVDTTKLVAGEYTVVATIAGDGKYLPSNDTASFKINKLTPSIVIAAGEAIEGSDVTVEVSVAGATGIVNINGENVTLADAKATTTFTDLLAGNMVVNVIYYGDANYLNATNSLTVPVKAKQNAGLVVSAGDINVGETATVVIVINANVTGKVTIDGNEVDIADGKGIYNISGLTAGEHTVTAIFAGDKYFKAETANATFKVNKLPSQVSVKVNKQQYSVGDAFDITVVNNTAAVVTINNNPYEVKDGKVIIDTSKLAAGEYAVAATIAENDKYLANSSTVTFKVAKVETPANSTTIPVDGSAKESKTPTYTINLPSDATGTLIVTINGKNYTGDVVNGKANVKVDDLKPGSYKATITYSGDAKYSPIVKNTTSTVVVDPKVVAKQTSVLYTGKYSVTVYGKDGKVAKSQAVKFYINGKYVKTVKTTSKGVATFNIPSKYPPTKKYTVKAVALGKTASKKVTVKQILTLKTVKVKKSGKLVLTATVKKVNGKYPKGKITFKFRGNKVKIVSLKNGVAKVTVPTSKYSGLSVGTTVKYSATYLKTTVQKKTKVKA